MRFFRLFFYNLTPNRPLMNSRRYSCIKFDYPRIVRTSAKYTVERHAFPGYNSRKVKTFRRLYCGKACHSVNYQTGFSAVKSAEILTFRGFSCGKACLSEG
jgi:hypothetical protein